ncbi:hypothetical protein GCM10011584_03200 [Nocardioides phosphati]|uniref:Endonuclease/exonuclease/phosphatase domain-containing protein n=1 Tax=Nocardioides phosphati TaxID=1867775 RepID=A0ABQ2N708_9ACTN|nr:endonuclease/exonuclease/phosphatase family protein [Nocardioides phosphati]GGO84787.1 hypothetical protein GCM10011584_03200 [Nocardioides phosphati]
MRAQLRQTLATVGLVLVLVLVGGALLIAPRLAGDKTPPAAGAPAPTPTTGAPGTALPSPGTDEFDKIFKDAPSPAALRRTMKRKGLVPVGGPPPTVSLDVSVASFNVLGASHTRGPERRKRFAGALARVPGQVAMLDQRSVTIAGLQEFQTPQVHGFLARTRGQWEVYPGVSMGPLLADNSLAWRKDTWEAVERRIVEIPYFGGNPRGMPYVLLQNRTTGHRVWVANFHNPANIGGNFARFRAAALSIEAQLAKRLGANGTPVIFTGDMNDRQAFACPFTAESGMHSADGARTDAAGCHLPPRLNVDWILGNRKVRFSQFLADFAAQHRRLTDHPLITAVATLPAVSNAAECRFGASTKGYLWFCPRTRH